MTMLSLRKSMLSMRKSIVISTFTMVKNMK
jgi:hypothetical protein